MGDDREEIARLLADFNDYVRGEKINRVHIIRAAAVMSSRIKAILARAQGSGPGEAVALKWEESLRPDEFEANTPFGRYFVCNLRGYHLGYGVRFRGLGVAGKFDVHDFETPKQAIAAGNAHWASMLASLYAATPTREA